MRKNLEKVVTSFELGKPSAKLGASCSTNGKMIYSYLTPIAGRTVTGEVWIVALESVWSNTTRGQVKALWARHPKAVSISSTFAGFIPSI